MRWGKRKPRYYYDLRTGEVVQGKTRGATNRMGPYDSAEEAAQAMERARERDEAWQAEEEAWEGDDPGRG